MRILIVDDDEVVLRSLDALLRQSGFRTTSVETGLAALEAAEKEEFDLVLLDVVLPDLNGIEVCRELKTRADHFLPVILVTAQVGSEGKIDGLESGADDYIVKPFDSRELVARVKSLLRIKALHDEVRHLAELREQIVYTVTHDFRTPLVGIRGAIQNLLGGLVGPLSDEQREYLDLVDQATRRLSELTNRMARAASEERARGEPERAEVDLRKAAETAVAGYRPEMVKRKIRLQIAMAEDAPQAWGEETAITRVLANLIDNAVKHSPDGGRIRVDISRKVSSRGPECEVVVTDEGEGIARSEFQRIFYRFEQVGKGLGTGLGLAICKEIVEAHGGSIRVESEPGQGARFHVALPAAVPVGGAA